MRADFFRNQGVREFFEKLRESGVGVFPAMPHIFRQNAADQYEREFGWIQSFPMDGILVRNYDTIQFLREHGFDKPVILDHNLYVFNRYGKRFWREDGTAEFTAPLELNEGELSRLGISDAELIVYGHIPVMLSAQCLVNTASGCTGKPGITFLTDRYKKKFPVRNCCRFCYNIIYNSEPLYLGAQAERIRALCPKRLRLQFSTESGRETSEILELADRAFASSGEIVPDFSYTQGHFKRGII